MRATPLRTRRTLTLPSGELSINLFRLRCGAGQEEIDERWAGNENVVILHASNALNKELASLTTSLVFCEPTDQTNLQYVALRFATAPAPVIPRSKAAKSSALLCEFRSVGRGWGAAGADGGGTSLSLTFLVTVDSV